MKRKKEKFMKQLREVDSDHTHLNTNIKDSGTNLSVNHTNICLLWD